MTERRTANRMDLEISTRAELVGIENKGGEVSWLITKDVSASGAYLRCENPFPVASKLRLLMDMGRHWVEIMGNVVRVDSQGMGVQFATVQVTDAR